jgi:hypothetical protein
MVKVYIKIKSQNMSESEFRQIWKETYCKSGIQTFDKVIVSFYEDMFDHTFFESANRKKKDKSILSLNRLEKIYCIKDTLCDTNAILKKGWNNDEKKYFQDRRVAIVKGNYVVIIRFTGLLKAKFVTAYEKNDIENILKGPDFEKSEKFFGEEKA